MEERFHVRRLWTDLRDRIKGFVVTWGELLFESEYSETPDFAKSGTAYFLVTAEGLLAYTDETVILFVSC